MEIEHSPDKVVGGFNIFSYEYIFKNLESLSSPLSQNGSHFALAQNTGCFSFSVLPVRIFTQVAEQCGRGLAKTIFWVEKVGTLFQGLLSLYSSPNWMGLFFLPKLEFIKKQNSYT